MKIVIVGGVAGGASAAARARRLSEEAEIIIFERGPDVSFANCGLPYHIGGEIPDRARLNVVICSQAMVALARQMEERYDIPFIEAAFYGLRETAAALRTIAAGLVARGAPAALIERAESLIAAETARARERLAPHLPGLAGKRVLLYSGGVKSWSVIAALQDLGMTVIGTSVRKSTDDDKSRARALLGDEAEMFGQIPAKDLDRRLRAGEADILVSGGRSQFTALKARVPWLDINQERHHAFAGFDGFVELARRLDLEINSPIWRQVRHPAPWETGVAARDAASPGDAEDRP